MFAVMREQLMGFVKDSDISIIPRLLLNAGVRLELQDWELPLSVFWEGKIYSIWDYARKNAGKAAVGTFLCYPLDLLYFCQRTVRRLSAFQHFGNQ